MMVPQGYIPVCDLKMIFSICSKYFGSNSDEKRFFDNAKEENWRAAYRVSMGKKETTCVFFCSRKIICIASYMPTFRWR